MIGAGLNVAGGIFGGIAAARARRRQKRALRGQLAENERWYNKTYYEDATQRADAQRLFTTLQDKLNANARSAAGRAAVTGGGDELVAQTKAANAAAMGELASSINAQGEARKAAVEEQYRAKRDNIQAQIDALDAGQAANIAQATQALGATAGTIADNVDGLHDYFALARSAGRDSLS